MATDKDDPSLIIKRGKIAWSQWRKNNPGYVSFSNPNWYSCPGPNGAQVKGANEIDMSGVDMTGVSIYHAFAEGLDLRGATFTDAHVEEGDFSRADFRGAVFVNTRFNKTILTNANFDGATFINCNINRANLVGASFRVKEIRETVIYGVSTWDLITSEDMKQEKLVIEKTYSLYSEMIDQGKVPMTVDDIELAQFIYYLSNHKKMRDAINVLNNKGVLLLGRFKDGGLNRLYSIREHLQKKDYMPMIFDFERPDSLSLTETVITMAGLSKFIVADLSGSSVPAELQAILAGIRKPVLAFGDAYALLTDLFDKTKIITVDSSDANLLNNLENKLPELEHYYEERILDLVKRSARH